MIKKMSSLVFFMVWISLCMNCSDTSSNKQVEIKASTVLKKELEPTSNADQQKEKKKWIPYKDRQVKGASGTETHKEDGKIRQIFTSIPKKIFKSKEAINQLFSDFITVYEIETGESIFLFASAKAAKDAYFNDIYDGKTWKADYLGRYVVGDDHFTKYPRIKKQEVAVELSTEATFFLASK